MARRKISVFICVAVVCCLLSACGRTSGSADTDDKALTETDNSVLKIAVSSTMNEPFVYTDDSGETVGFDADLARLIAAELGKEAVFLDMEESMVLSSLGCGVADMAVGAIEESDDARELADFSDGYITLSSAVTVSADSVINGTSSLWRAESVAVVYGSLSHIYARDELGLGNMLVSRSFEDAANALLTGEADALLADEYLSEEFAAENTGFVICEKNADKHTYCVAVPKENSTFLRQINSVVREFKTDGTMLDLRIKYLK